MSKDSTKTPDPIKTLDFKFNEKNFTINFPNTGELMELSILKAKLSDGNYNAISNTDLLEDKLAQFSIDTVSHLTIMCPDLLKHLNVKSYLDLDLVDMKRLISVYVKSILPWMNSWYKVLNSMDED